MEKTLSTKILIQRAILLAFLAAIVDCDENTTAEDMRNKAAMAYLKIQEEGCLIDDGIHKKVCEKLIAYADKIDAIETVKEIINQKQ